MSQPQPLEKFIKIPIDIIIYGKSYKAGLEFKKFDSDGIMVRETNTTGQFTDRIIRMSDLFPPYSFTQVTVDQYFEAIMNTSGAWDFFTVPFDVKLPDGRICKSGSTFEKVSDNVVECSSALSPTGKFITQIIRLDKLGMTANEFKQKIKDLMVSNKTNYVNKEDAVPDTDPRDPAPITKNTPEDWAELKRDNTKLRQVFCPYNADMVVYDVHNNRVNDLCGLLTREKYHEIMRRSSEETQFDGLKTFKCKACALGAIANEHDHKEPGEYTTSEGDIFDVPEGAVDDSMLQLQPNKNPAQQAPRPISNNPAILIGTCNIGGSWNSANNGSNTTTNNNPLGNAFPNKKIPPTNSFKSPIDIFNHHSSPDLDVDDFDQNVLNIISGKNKKC